MASAFTVEERTIAGYRFLTQKPLLLIFNIGEDAIPQRETLETEWRARYAQPPKAAGA